MRCSAERVELEALGPATVAARMVLEQPEVAPLAELRRGLHSQCLQNEGCVVVGPAPLTTTSCTKICTFTTCAAAISHTGSVPGSGERSSRSASSMCVWLSPCRSLKVAQQLLQPPEHLQKIFESSVVVARPRRARLSPRHRTDPLSAFRHFSPSRRLHKSNAPRAGPNFTHNR